MRRFANYTVAAACLVAAACGSDSSDASWQVTEPHQSFSLHAADCEQDEYSAEELWCPDGGKYENLGDLADKPTYSIPENVELALCSARDSRIEAFEVTEGVPVRITFINPGASYFNLSIVRTDNDRYESYPGAEEVDGLTFGCGEMSSVVFTPEESGQMAVYTAAGLSVREPIQLTVETTGR